MAEAETDLDRPTIPDVPIAIRAVRPFWVRGMACLALLTLLGFIGFEGRSLWGEFWSLRREQATLRQTDVVGYVSINPKPSYARKPNDWLHDEGDTTLLWAGWINDEHQWYRLAKGDIDPQRISHPLGKDVIRAIDYPIFEEVGGAHWNKIPDEALVAGFGEDRDSTAFPLIVLDKVEVINHQIDGRPVLVVYTPVDNAVSFFDAKIDGNRVTMGHGGYFFGHHPILYDRGTDSLWSQQDGVMVSVGDRRKGATLAKVAQLPVLAWSEWRASHPNGRLLIGADRSQAKPLN